jgi:hypothetical protein
VRKKRTKTSWPEFEGANRGGPRTQWKLPENIGTKTSLTFQTNKAVWTSEGFYFMAFAVPKKHGAATFYLVGSNDSASKNAFSRSSI